MKIEKKHIVIAVSTVAVLGIMGGALGFVVPKFFGQKYETKKIENAQ